MKKIIKTIIVMTMKSCICKTKKSRTTKAELVLQKTVTCDILDTIC